MDETGLCLDITLDEQGARMVAIKTTGYEKDRFTVVLGARADGYKMHPMVIFKGKRKDKALGKLTGVVIEMQDNGWMTEVAANDLGRCGSNTRAMNASVGHFPSSQDRPCETLCRYSLQHRLGIILPGCTPLLQPPDLSWNKPFKERYSELWDQWSIRSLESYTAAGNQLAPTKELCVTWVKMAWASLSTETILRSFKCAGITTAVDGQEDMLITCLADNEDLAKEVHKTLYGKPEEQARSPEQEGVGEGLVTLSEDSNSDFDGFDPDSLLS